MSKVSVEEGRKRVRRGVRRPLAEWDVLLKDQHEGYISWAEFERNQRVIANNATGKGSAVARGAARHGELALTSFLRCDQAVAICSYPWGCAPIRPSARRCCES